MDDSNNRFKFLKKISSKLDNLFLGDLIQSKDKDSNGSMDNHLVEDYLFNQINSNLQDNSFKDNFGENDYSKYDSEIHHGNFGNDKYSKYIYLEEFDDKQSINNTNKDELLFNNSDYYSKYHNLDSKYDDSKLDYGNFNDFEGFNKVDDLGSFNNTDNSRNINSKSYLSNLKNKLLNSDKSFKRNFGLVAIILIILVLASSVFYFGVFQPFQNELDTSKTAKLNELNTLYKGPLSVDSHYYELKHQIEDASRLEDVNSIDILRTATGDWREYHVSKINAFGDSYGRIMMSYSEEETKKVLMSCDDAKSFVKDNDGKILSNVQFEKVDTVIVPISINRLQATGGLISVGSIVDIYSLSSNDSYYLDSSSSGSNPSDSEEPSSVSESENMNSNDEQVNDSNIESSDLSSNNNDYSDDENEDIQKSTNENSLNSSVESIKDNNSKLSAMEEPDVSGATVLAILRSKESGVVDSEFIKSTNLVKGNRTYPTEKSSSFSTDVEELLKYSLFTGQDDNTLSSYLDNYGIKLSNYERLSNIGELDTDYLVLLEIPRADVMFIINNMDSLILTIPTEYAPNWVVNELSSTYYNELNYNQYN